MCARTAFEIAAEAARDGSGRRDTGDGGEDEGFLRHERAVSEVGMETRGRRDAFTDPAVEGDEKGALSPGVVVRIRLVHSDAAGGAVQRGRVLSAGELVDADIIGDGGVLFAIERGVDEGGG